MAAVIVNPKHVHSFASEAAFERWLAKNHASAPELWLKIHKKNSGKPSVTAAEAIDVVLCWGWIDGIRKAFDEDSFLQRFTPRRAKSIWSQINRDKVARLTAAGRMTEHGQTHIDLAKADGRWAAAYAPARGLSASALPSELLKAIAANPRAQKTFETLDRKNLFSLAFRTAHAKTAAGRAKRIATLVATLARGEPIVAAAAPRARAKTKSRRG